MNHNKLIISPHHAQKNYFQDIWKYRDLFFILTWRDIKVRYKQTIIGVLWAVLRPLLVMVLFTIVFERILELKSTNGIPYYLQILTGLLPWYLFSSAMNDAASALIDNEKLITKVYFPRLIIPISSVITAGIDFLISLVLLVILLLFHHIYFSTNLLILPLLLFILLSLSIGTGILFSALNVKYRDVRYVIPFITQVGFYISPIGFLSEKVPNAYQLLFYLNPMAGIIDGFRYCFLNATLNQNQQIGIIFSFVISFVFLWIGIYVFRKNERAMADYI